MSSIASTVEKLRSHRPAILPSMLQCDFGNIQHLCERMQAANADVLHLDVMDGVFVPNLSYGIPIVKAFRDSTDALLDVHLMIQDPEKYVPQFAAAGADLITFHLEAASDPRQCIEQIHSCDCAAGIAVNPGTPLEPLLELIPTCELVLIMSVHAGFGGQSFIPEALSRLQTVREHFPETLLEVDGGINADTISACAEVGVDLFVVGSAVFNHEDYGQAISQLETLANPKQKNA